MKDQTGRGETTSGRHSVKGLVCLGMVWRVNGGPQQCVHVLTVETCEWGLMWKRGFH